MPLPVLPAARAPATDADLLRLFHRTERLWADPLGEPTQLDAGVAVANPDLPTVPWANRVLEAALPPGGTPAAAVAEVDAHFAAAGARCLLWQLDPSAPAGRTDPLAEHLLSIGHARRTDDVMALAGRPSRPDVTLPPGVTILPARAALRQAHALALTATGSSPDPQQGAAAQLLHLDDPRCDGLLALRDGQAVGRATVLAVGDVGRVDQVFVAVDARRQGLGRALVARALEVCARSLFRHVLLSVGADNAGAIALYRAFGFRRVGTLTTYRRAANGGVDRQTSGVRSVGDRAAPA